MTWGVIDTGFLKKALSDIQTEVQTGLKEKISTHLNFLPSSVIGQITGIFDDKLRELWDVAESVYRSLHPDYATRDALDQIMAYTGVLRLASGKTRVNLDRLLLEDATTIPAGYMVSIGDSGTQFVTLEAVVNATGFTDLFSVLAESTEYGDLPAHSGSVDTIKTGVAGWTAKAAMKCTHVEPYAVGEMMLSLYSDVGNETFSFAAGGPYTAAQIVAVIMATAVNLEAVDADGYLLVFSNTDGEGSSIRAAEHFVYPPDANEIFEFPSIAVTGMNSEDGDPGRDIESDHDARLRREELLAASGCGTSAAIKAALIELSFVNDAKVYENEHDIVENEIPPHSIECLLDFDATGTGDEEQEIVDTIWGNKGAGIGTWGNQSGLATDVEGTEHTVRYSIPTEVPIYFSYEVQVETSEFPLDGDDQIKAAVLALGNTLLLSEDVIAIKFQAEPLSIAGVYDVIDFHLSIHATPDGTTNIIIGAREKATFDIDNIDVVVTPI